MFGLFTRKPPAGEVLGHRPGLELDRETVLVAFASQTGVAERLARSYADALQRAGHRVVLSALGALGGRDLLQARRALFITSTTGEGGAPDSAVPFVRKAMRETFDLGRLQFAVLALGDRSYDHYCGFGHDLAEWLNDCGGRTAFPTVEVDDEDPQALANWTEQLTSFLGAFAPLSSAKPPFTQWRLVRRDQLNLGSVGAGAYHIELAATQGGAQWTAGDIAQVSLAMGPDGTADYREYSIASLPRDGHLHLLVRQQRNASGELGLGSGLLTDRAKLGGSLWLRVRQNPSFHPPPDGRPLILIANGTGMAGLRAHLRHQADCGAGGHWLLFGERSRATDFYYCEEIEAWLRDGVLARLDLAFSRDQERKVYVQHRLASAGPEIKRWLARDGMIYICGSLRGMFADVNQTLVDLVGEACVDDLVRTGRIRKDVY